MKYGNLSWLITLPMLYQQNISAQGIDSFIADQISNQISRSTSGSISKNLSDQLIVPQLKIRNPSGEVKDFSVSTHDRFFNILHEDGTFRIWDSDTGVQRPVIFPTSTTFTQSLSSETAGLAFIADHKGDIGAYEILTGKLQRVLSGQKSELTALALTESENLLAAAYENGRIDIWQLEDFSKLKTLETDYSDNIKFITFSPDNKTIFIASEDGFIDIWSLENSTKVVSLPKLKGDIINLRLSTNASAIASIDDTNALRKYNVQNQQIVLNQRISSEEIIASAINSAIDLIAIANDNNSIKIISLPSFQLVHEIKRTDKITHLNFINQDKQLLGSDAKGVIHVWDIASAQEKLKLISTDTGWTVIDDKGRFDSSESRMKNVSWEAANQDIPVDKFSTNYYEPGLVTTTLDDGRFINEQPKTIQQGITLPPEVHLYIEDEQKTAGQEITIIVDTMDSGGGIKELKLFHNGKIVNQKFKLTTEDSEIEGRLNRKSTYTVIPTAGTNHFKAVATNQMDIESQSAELSPKFSGPEQPSTLHVITIGINKYKDSRMNLDYSVADAKSIADALNNENLTSFKEVIQHSLLDEQATKEAIMNRLRDIAQFNHNDVMVVYFAGHGIAINSEWYFLPFETTLGENEQHFIDFGLSAQEIQNLLAEIPAKKMLVMVDACYSGAGINSFKKLQNSQRHFSRKLSKSVGLVVLAATRKDQEAAELSDLGHGLFTYVVTKGLGGEADLRPHNQQISAHEIANFSTETIPDFSKKYLGASQEPTSFTMGTDFNLLKN